MPFLWTIMPLRQIQFFDHAHPSIANETVVNSAVSIKKIERKLYLDRDFARGFTFFRKKHSMDNHAV